MALLEFVQKFLDESKIKIFKESDFKPDPDLIAYNKDDITIAYVASDLSASTSKVRVVIKKFNRFAERSFTTQYVKQQEAMSSRMLKYFERECRVWNCSGETHPNIIKFHGVVLQGDGQLPAFVSQFANVGSLRALIADESKAQLPLGQKLKLMCDVAEGLSFLHRRRTLHRDLKASNIMLDYRPDGTLVALLGDFGSAKDFDGVLDSNSSTAFASITHMSPEQLKSPHDFDGAKDIWSFGCATLEILGWQKHVWPIGTTHQTISASLSCGEHPPRPAHVSETNAVWIFIETRCFCKSPRDRVVASQVRGELERLS